MAEREVSDNENYEAKNGRLQVVGTLENVLHRKISDFIKTVSSHPSAA